MLAIIHSSELQVCSFDQIKLVSKQKLKSAICKKVLSLFLLLYT